MSEYSRKDKLLSLRHANQEKWEREAMITGTALLILGVASIALPHLLREVNLGLFDYANELVGVGLGIWGLKRLIFGIGPVRIR